MNMNRAAARMSCLLALLLAAPAAAVPVPVADPVPGPPVRKGQVGLKDFLVRGELWLGEYLFHSAVQGAQPTGNGRDLAIHDHRGVIWLTNPSGRTPVQFLDVRARADVEFDNSFNPGESGMHGVAFHPNYAGDPSQPGYGKFYTAVSVRPTRPADFHDDDNLNDSVLIEWTTDPRRKVYAELAPPREVLRIGDFENNHNVGTIIFNPTARPGDADYGKLYIGYGDGGGGNDPRNYGQDLTSPWGKVVRIDPLDPDGAGPLRYGVPSDNPFVGQGGAADLVWAYGFRHPQGLGFDRLTGDLYIYDFGQANLEEVNLGVAGGNYGWQIREGTFLTSYAVNGDKVSETVWSDPDAIVGDGLVYPVAQYDHDEGRGVTSGQVYRGTLVPELYGKLVFTDVVRGRLFYIELADIALGSQAPLYEFDLVHNGLVTTLQDLAGAGPLMRTDARIGFDHRGELYITTKAYGRVYQLVSLIAVPAPGPLALFGMGAAALAGRRRR
jgi:hypothetical protein